MWQPIETAPKGKRILGAYTTSGGKWNAEVCAYHNRYGKFTVSSGKGFPATHWTSLPKPPGGTG